ncbi:MAG: crotonyl-CoA carboxylase/reductase [Leptospiraceae bacterium]|nr:crotonyl-CoA carboxylase/reductase [Leptospiraceae bacterium]MCB1201903.1 crotonyl-CoA carboxylase/reductase [Leptospiraceae bacterium]
MAKELYEIGEVPPLGEIPKKMYAQVIREDRFGEPAKAFQIETVEVPEIGPDDALVLVMAAGINYNNVWASLGIPLNMVDVHRKDQGDTTNMHIGGSDASGIVYKIGSNVKNVKVGDKVVIHCGMWDVNHPDIVSGKVDPIVHTTNRIWGYETNWGSFAQFTRIQAHQLLPKPKHLTWEEAAAYMLVGATAYRMLMGFSEHIVEKDDIVLIWGGAGGLGSMAIQIVKAMGGIPIAIVSDNEKIDYCKKLGAAGVLNRKDFDHWGMLPHWKDTEGYNKWLKGVRVFGKALWEAIGERRNPKIVFEHPGETTIPTSCYVVDRGGMVVICAGTTGYNATVDLRYHWMHQKRLQGSHFANDEQSKAFNDLVIEKKVDPCLSKTYSFEGIRDCHQLMYENKHPHGNMAALVTATKEGEGKE